MPLRAKAKFLGHALHSQLVPIPLGALPTALVFDALYAWTGSAAWYMAAFVAALVGTLGLVAAVIPGYIDYAAVVPQEGPATATARTHLGLGIGVTVFYALFLVLRLVTLRDPGPFVAWSVLALNALGVIGLLAQGWLGGELVERHHIGVHEEKEGDGAPSGRGTAGGGSE